MDPFEILHAISKDGLPIIISILVILGFIDAYKYLKAKFLPDFLEKIGGISGSIDKIHSVLQGQTQTFQTIDDKADKILFELDEVKKFLAKLSDKVAALSGKDS